MASEPALRVAVGVLINAAGEVLIAWRDSGRHQGGCWEFPGGKIKRDEPALHALGRELDEELGIEVLHSKPLIQIPYAYSDRRVLLEVFEVTQWRGELYGREGQALHWCSPHSLDPADFPAANQCIITALRLPAHYVITPHCEEQNAWLSGLDAALARGERLLQFRVRAQVSDRMALARLALARCHSQGAKMLVNHDFRLAAAIGADGVQVNAQQLTQGITKPEGFVGWLGASCHNRSELAAAQAMGADFALLSPIQPTQSHPQTIPLGWPTFSQWVAEVAMPVYALGGMQASDVRIARIHGGQGVAGISGFWGEIKKSS